jgi:hypothetical protein
MAINGVDTTLGDRGDIIDARAIGDIPNVLGYYPQDSSMNKSMSLTMCKKVATTMAVAMAEQQIEFMYGAKLLVVTAEPICTFSPVLKVGVSIQKLQCHALFAGCPCARLLLPHQALLVRRRTAKGLQSHLHLKLCHTALYCTE